MNPLFSRSAPPGVVRAGFALVLVALVAGVAGAGVGVAPKLIHYQGTLRDSGGVPVDSAGLAMTFRFYNTDGGGCPASGGRLLLTDAHAAVPVSAGLFGVQLGGGSLTAGDASGIADTFVHHTEVWLEIQVAGETLCPRVRVLSAPYAVGGASATDGALDLYVAATGGADSNSGLTPDVPKATISAAVAAIPTVINGDVNIRIAAGTYQDSVIVSQRERTGPFWIRLLHATADPETDPPQVIVEPIPGSLCAGCANIGVLALDELVEIKGLTVRGFTEPTEGGSAGVTASGGTNLTLFNCRLEGNDFGVVATDGHFVEIGHGSQILGSVEAGLLSANHGTIEVNEPVTFCDNAESAGVAERNSSIQIFAEGAGCQFCPTDGPMLAGVFSSVELDGDCGNFSCGADASSFCGAPSAGGTTSAVCLSGVSNTTCTGCAGVCVGGTAIAGGWAPSVCEITSDTGSCSANPLGLGTCCCLCGP